MRMKAFQHVLSLDQAYFDNHSASAIRGSMNAHSINNLITWNIPYLITLNLQFFMTAIYMLRIGKSYLVHLGPKYVFTFQFFNDTIYSYTKKRHLTLGNLAKLVFWSILLFKNGKVST